MIFDGVVCGVPWRPLPVPRGPGGEGEERGAFFLGINKAQEVSLCSLVGGSLSCDTWAVGWRAVYRLAGTCVVRRKVARAAAGCDLAEHLLRGGASLCPAPL